MVSLNEQQRINWVEKTLGNIPAGLKLLDAGAGEQQYKKFCAHLDYTSQDFAQYTGQNTDSGLQTGTWDYGKLDIICDIINIPRADNSFDIILCTEVLEHIPDPQAALKEFSRLLKSGGKLILTAPFCSMTHFAPYHYCTGFSRYYYEKHLPDLGFKITEMTPNGNYFASMAQEAARIPHVAMNYGMKKPGRLKLMALQIVQKMLNDYSSADKASSELMCFGWHVTAEKI